MGKDDKNVSFLSDLGRANMRGLRKCKKCGTLTGTRGFACKNLHCDMVFKDAPNKKSFSDVVKLESGNCRQIYSTRLKEKGPDDRGFVELATETGILLPAQTTTEILHDDRTKCHFDVCGKSRKYNLGVQSICKHIWSAQQCRKEAKTLILRNTSTHLIQLPSSMKNELWQLATESPGPLVQRVSKTVMVVKCKADSIHPLGFLHISFHQLRNKKEAPVYFCECSLCKEESALKFDHLKNCIHFYACIMAFASNEALAEEFSYFINLVKSINNNFPVEEKPNIAIVGSVNLEADCKTDVDESSFLILNNNGSESPCRVEVEVLADISDDPLMIPIDATENEDLESKLEIQVQADDTLELHTSECGRVTVHQLPNTINLSRFKRKDDDTILKQNMNIFPSKKLKVLRKPSFASNKIVRESNEELTSFNFSSWLSSVAERINQTMQYGFPGKPDPLVFHIPKSFFNCILDRIKKYACGKGKKCSVERNVFTISNAIPLGTFTKLTWKLTNLAHVVNVFSSDRPLKTAMYFTECKNGKFKSCDPPVMPKLIEGLTQRPVMKPHELKTLLNVGNVCSTKEPVPFIIEWISDIIPQSEIGELRLKFEFVHYNSNRFVGKLVTLPANVKPNRQILPLAPKIPPNKVPLPFNSSTEVIGLPVSHDFSPGDIAILTF